MIQGNIVAVASIAEDSRFIRSDGISTCAKGILSSVAQEFNGNSTFNLANAVSDLLKACTRWVCPSHAALGMDVQSAHQVRVDDLAATSDGYFPFRMSFQAGRFFGVPYRTTNSIPKTGGNLHILPAIWFGDSAGCHRPKQSAGGFASLTSPATSRRQRSIVPGLTSASSPDPTRSTLCCATTPRSASSRP